ncbi:2',3'-cyclic-nucleotide 2'-phosphodiesterase, Bsub YmdB [[Mycoplasma] cavipharyngis]|uniref:TIGR00282 family metallophosphoesterase n=1 Tax=[Mycoplasma] cavipharyngis TaxID=92757 RepID=UPI0037047D0E
MRILFIGDIFGKPGRKMVNQHLNHLIEQHKIDFVIANAENAAHGKGITWKIYHQLKRAKIDFFTMGNHTWNKSEGLEILAQQDDIIRPINLSEDFIHYNIGVGSKVVVVNQTRIRITNMLGGSIKLINANTKQNCVLNPFVYLEKFLIDNQDHDIHILDFHSETTSEKNAILRAFNGKLSAILGTHTHVPTNDFQIYNHTAYITDVGMTGPFEGIIGAEVNSILAMFYQKSDRFRLDVAKGLKQLSAVVLEFDQNHQIKKFWPIILREDNLSGAVLMKKVS